MNITRFFQPGLMTLALGLSLGSFAQFPGDSLGNDGGDPFDSTDWGGPGGNGGGLDLTDANGNGIPDIFENGNGGGNPSDSTVWGDGGGNPDDTTGSDGNDGGPDLTDSNGNGIPDIFENLGDSSDFFFGGDPGSMWGDLNTWSDTVMFDFDGNDGWVWYDGPLDSLNNDGPGDDPIDTTGWNDGGFDLTDANNNGIPDIFEGDNGDGPIDSTGFGGDDFVDANGNGIPDILEGGPLGGDSNGDGTPADSMSVYSGSEVIQYDQRILTESTSEFIEVSLASVYPNPVINQLNVAINAEKSGMAMITIYSINGQLAYSNNANLAKGYNLISIDFGSAVPGNYIIRVSDTNGQNAKVIVKE